MKLKSYIDHTVQLIRFARARTATKLFIVSLVFFFNILHPVHFSPCIFNSFIFAQTNLSPKSCIFVLYTYLT